MAGEADLSKLLSSLAPVLDAREFAFCSVKAEAAEALVPEAWATVREAEGMTLILEASEARARGLPVEATWALVTLSVQSSLGAVGLLAAVSAALAAAGISVNAISAYYHDHLLVPWGERRRALSVLQRLSEESP
jgi:hypothetical protein